LGYRGFGGQTLVLHILGVLGGYLGSGSFSPNKIENISRKSRTIQASSKRYHHHTIYIYIYTGGAIGGIWGIGGFGGYRPFIDSPPDI
jgi:hypothetical protein